MGQKNDFLIDQRSREELLDEICKLAKAYTPEWKFSRKNPDAGSVIAMIFADQTLDNLRQINLMLEKYHTSFANMCGISLRAAHPATTIAVLAASGTLVSGVPFYKGTQLLGMGEEQQEVVFEAMHDLYVTRACLTDILAVSAAKQKVIPYKGAFFKQDLITGKSLPVFGSKDEERDEIPLFCFDGDSIREQALIVCHRFLFGGTDTPAALRFHGSGKGGELAEQLMNEDNYGFYLCSEEGLVRMESFLADTDTIGLSCSSKPKRITDGDMEYAAIVIKTETCAGRPLAIDRIEIITQSVQEMPDFVYDGNKELDSRGFLPFGCTPALYDECYIGKERWMGRIGFTMTMSFTLEFGVFRETGKREQTEELKIIKRKPRENWADAGYESVVQEVLVEYFNGKGWKKLECTPAVEELFADEGNAGEHSITFDIPSDWEQTIQGGYEEKTLRFQVKRADNCYMPRVEFIYPVIQNFMLRIDSKKPYVFPDRVEYVDGLARKDITEELVQGRTVKLFGGYPLEGEFMYLGFDRKFEEGPIGIWWGLKEKRSLPGGHIEYAYSAEDGFHPLKVKDYTNNFQEPERIVFMPQPDQEKTVIEGVERYWLRIQACGPFCNSKKNYPVAEHIYVNAVKIQNIETGEEQDYYIDNVKPGMSFPLNTDNILKADVWVNETGQLSRQEMKILLDEKGDIVRAEYNTFGEIEDFYVRWQEADSFAQAPKQARIYVIDRGLGAIHFGDGVHARIPQNTKSVAFKVRVTRCSGSLGNLPPGKISGFRGNYLSVESVFNPVGAMGGSDPESMEEALARAGGLLGARKRLVSEQDYIRIAEIFVPEVDQAACIVGRTVDGEEKDGSINLVLLLREYKAGSYIFPSLASELKAYMEDKCEITCRKEDLEVVAPVFVAISVEIHLRVRDVEDSLDIRDRWLKNITEFFEPVSSGAHGGWKIGTLPGEGQVHVMLNSLGKDAWIESCYILAAYQGKNGKCEKMLDDIKVSPYMVCCNGEHRIIIVE